MNKNFINIIKNPFMQIIIIVICLILIFAILLKFKKNNIEHFYDLSLQSDIDNSINSTSNVNKTVAEPAAVIVPPAAGIKPDKINEKKETNIFSLPDREIYKLLNDITMKDIVIKYFELKYNEFKNNSDNISHVTMMYNNKNITIQEFKDDYLSIIDTINIPAYNNFLKEVFESDEINTKLLVGNFITLEKIYSAIVNVSYLFQLEYYNKITAIEKNFYSVILKKFNSNYEEISYFSNKLYYYLHKNIGDSKLFNDAVKNSYNFIYNIYNNKEMNSKSILSTDYETKKELTKMNYCDIFFDLLNNSTNENLKSFIDTLSAPDYIKKIDKFNHINEQS
jgi:hypothetical protein